MNKNIFKNPFFYFVTILGITFAMSVFAAGLVPCNGPDCDLCDLFVLGKNIIDFLWVAISMPLAVLMLVVAAFVFIISGANPSLHSRAKSIATAAIVGLVITFSSWLIVGTVINWFANTGSFPWPWNSPTC